MSANELPTGEAVQKVEGQPTRKRQEASTQLHREGTQLPPRPPSTHMVPGMPADFITQCHFTCAVRLVTNSLSLGPQAKWDLLFQRAGS